jgi:polyhydroxybutyrate depolymerase
MRAFALCLLAACSPALRVPDAGAPDGGWVSGRYTIAWDGVDRTFWLDVPATLPEHPPVVLVMHGYSESATRIRDYAGFSELVDAEGFLAVYPDGTRDQRGLRFFDVGYAFHDRRVDDVGYLRALVDRLATDLGADRDAVFATGMSNGGDMSYLLACLDEPFVRAIAPVAGGVFESFADPCQPSRRVDVAEFHGTNDDVTWWDGDPTGEGGWGPYWGIERAIGHFATWYELEASEETDLPDRDPTDGSTVRLFRAYTAADATEVRLYSILGGGHAWPGNPGANGDLDTAGEIWSFFARTLDR